jgi:hypothetical protein
MSEVTVRQQCRMFKDGQTNVPDEEWSGQPSVVSIDLFRSADQKIWWKMALHNFRTFMW